MPAPDLQHLHTLIQHAIELEFATIPPYLTAMYTIKPDTNLPAYNVIRSVVMEEMLHLTLAANLLNAVGGRVALTTPGLLPEYPIQLKFTDRQFPIDLQKFSPQAIDTFLNIERPAILQAKPQLLVAQGFRDLDVPGHSIGEFYQELIDTLTQACAEYGEAQVFTGDPTWQVDTRYYYGGGGEALCIRSLAEAMEAVHIIVDQGEAGAGSIDDGDASFGQMAEVAHYYRFNEIKHGRYYQLTDKPSDEPSGAALPVDYNAVYDMQPNPRQADYPAGSELAQQAAQFNDVYSNFIAVLQRAFSGEPQALVQAVTIMYELKSKALELIKNPIPGGAGRHAGPGFEYVAPAAGQPLPAPVAKSRPVYFAR
jgi:hypothetical protein